MLNNQEAQAMERLETAERVGRFGSWEVDLSSGSLYWSKGLRQLYGVGLDDVPSVEKLFQIIPCEDRTAFKNRIVVLETELPDTFEDEWQILKPGSGERRFYRFSGATIRANDGKLVKLVGITQDITEVVQARNLALAAARIKTAAEAMNAVTLTYRHEIHTPLTVALVSLELAASTEVDQPHISRAVEALDRIREILRDIDRVVIQATAEIAASNDRT